MEGCSLASSQLSCLCLSDIEWAMIRIRYASPSSLFEAEALMLALGDEGSPSFVDPVEEEEGRHSVDDTHKGRHGSGGR